MSLKKLEIGSGSKPVRGYIHMDAKKLVGVDIVGDVRKLPFPDNSLKEIYGHWILEHFAYQEITTVLKEWRRCLVPGGLLHLVTNNGMAHVESFLAGEISIHELNYLLFGIKLTKSDYRIEDLHKTIWTDELVNYFFKPLFSRVVIKETWKHREKGGRLKCPGIIIKAYK